MLPQTVIEDHFFAVTTIGPWVHIAVGDYPGALAVERERDERLDRSRDGRRRRAMVDRAQAEAEYRLGEWDAALERSPRRRPTSLAPNPAATLYEVAGRVQAGRGDVPAARAAVERAIELAIAPPASTRDCRQHCGGDRRASWPAPRRRGPRLRPPSRRGQRSESGSCGRPRPSAAWTADRDGRARRRGADTGDDLAAAAASMIRDLRISGRSGWHRPPARSRGCLAGASRRRRRSRPWERAAHELERIRYLPLAVTARQGEAEARLRRRRRVRRRARDPRRHGTTSTP